MPRTTGVHEDRPLDALLRLAGAVPARTVTRWNVRFGSLTVDQSSPTKVGRPPTAPVANSRIRAGRPNGGFGTERQSEESTVLRHSTRALRMAQF